MKPHFRLVLFLILLTLLTVLPVESQDSALPWLTSTPEAQGMDSGKLADLLESAQSGFTFDSILVIRHANVVLDVSTSPFSTSQPHMVHYVTENFVSTLMGIAIDKGFVKSADQSIWDFFDPAATANMDARKQAITIKHLLAQASGLSMTADDDARMYYLTASDPSWVQFVLDHPMLAAPGSGFFNLDSNAHLASAIIQKATGMTTLEFAQQYLFGPLGITDAVWLADPQGVNKGGQHLFLSPDDIAKLGYLYLHDGQWDGQQIVSSDWIAAATSAQVAIPQAPGAAYGYFWNMMTLAGHSTIGLGDLFVIPDSDLVVVVTGPSIDLAALLNSYFLPAVQSDTALLDNPEAQTRLKADVDALAHPVAATMPTLPDTAQQINGKLFTLGENDLHWKTVSFDFAGVTPVIHTSLIHLGIDDMQLDLPIGLDGVYRISSFGLPSEPLFRPLAGVPLAVKGEWRSDRLFVFNLADTHGMQKWSFLLNFNVSAGKFTGRAISTVPAVSFAIYGKLS